MKKRHEPKNDGPLQEPRIWETLREHLLGVRRLLDCIQVEVSTRCPGRCVYCPHTTSGDQWQSHDMDLETFNRLRPLMRRSSRVHLQGWGEPLLHPSFFGMAAIARKAGCSVSTTTSGLIMNEELAAEIVESGLDIVAFSLAGSDASSNASRHGVDFDRVCEAVRILQAVRRSRMGVHLEIHLAYLLLSSQMEAAVRLPKLMHSLGIHAAVVSTLDFIPSPDLAAEGFAPHETDKIARCATLLGKAQAEARRMGMDFHWSLPGARPLMSNCRENALRSLFVSADGFVSPCVYVNLPLKDGHPNRCVFGDVLDEDPPALWEGKEFREFRERLAGGAPDIPCVGCPKRFET